MKVIFATIFVALIFIANCLAAPADAEQKSNQSLEDLTRLRKAAQDLEEQQKRQVLRSASYGGPAPAYGGPAPGPISYSYQAPAPTMPCARNLLLSCHPSVAPVPCAAPHYSAPAPSYSAPAPASYSSGPSGAYSEPVPQWAVPVHYRQQNFYGY